MTTTPVEELDDEGVEETPPCDADDTEPAQHHAGSGKWGRLLAFIVLPVLALLLALGAGYLRWQDSSARDAQHAGIDAVAAARDGTIALLSYQPGTADKDLVAARDRLTGSFRDAYTKLTDEVVIPGAKEKQISAVATVPAAAIVSATENQAVTMLFVDQTTIVGSGAPTSSSSTVRVTVDKVGSRWLISDFEPI